MSLSRDQVQELAKRLMDAEANFAPVGPLTAEFSDLSPDDAYKVQLAVLDKRLASGRKIVAKKVGLTSKAMQDMFKVDTPDYGMILDDMIIENEAEYAVGKLLQPRVEPEVAFMLKSDLKGPNVTVEDVLAATDYVFPSLEVIDSRIKDWKITLSDTIADNASSARVVVGPGQVSVSGLDLVNEELVFEKNGEEIGRAKGEAVLGNPAAAVAWAANKLSEYGISLLAGEFVMPGAFVGATPVQAGDVIKATFAKVGTVSVKFV